MEQLVQKKIEWHEIDICDKAKMSELFKSHQFDAVIHFAALKAVGQSVGRPLEYYRNNVFGTLVLLEV